MKSDEDWLVTGVEDVIGEVAYVGYDYSDFRGSWCQYLQSGLGCQPHTAYQL